MLNNTINNILQSFVTKSKSRGYIGASGIGHNCLRSAWYNYKYTGEKDIEAKVSRMFRYGHLAEEAVKNDLIQAGFVIENGDYFDIPEKNFSGHVDGIITVSPTKEIAVPCLLEVKTVNTYKFKTIVKKGIASVYPSYVIQVHAYMNYIRDGILKSNPCLFVIIDRNDCNIYFETVNFDREYVKIIEQRVDILQKDELPPKGENLTWECDYCNFKDLCDKEEKC